MSEHIELTELERKVILTLAENGPMSGYDFHLGGKRQRGKRKALMSSGYWIRVLEHLGPNGLSLLEQVDLPRYHSNDERGRRKDLYWLTDEGILAALKNGVNLQAFRKTMKGMPGDHECEDLMFDLAEGLGSENMRFVVQTIEAIRCGEPIVLGLQNIDDKKASELLKLVKKYPQFAKLLKESRERISRLLGDELDERKLRVYVCV